LPTVGIGASRLHPPYNFARSAFASIPRSLLRVSSFSVIEARRASGFYVSTILLSGTRQPDARRIRHYRRAPTRKKG